MFSSIDRWIKKLAGCDYNDLPLAENIKLIYVNLLDILNQKGLEGKVIITSTIDDVDLNLISELLNEYAKSNGRISFCPIKNPLRDSDALKKLIDSTGAVLVEQNHKSSIVNVQDLVDYIADFDKEVLGYIYID